MGREAEADPALLYTSGLVGYPYAVGAHAVTYAGAPHAVAHTPFGTTHSSNVGICTNVSGAVVPCRRKREADADPALVYAGARPYTYGVLPYAGVHGTNPVHAVAHTAAGLTPPPTWASAPTTSVPSSLADCLTQTAHQ